MTQPAAREKHLEILTALANLPTAPYREEHVIAWVLAWARQQQPHLRAWQDRAGNVYIHYRRGRAPRHPLVVEAHMDHPGFVTTTATRAGTVNAHFFGGVNPDCFSGAAAKFFIPDPAPGAAAGPVQPPGRWAVARVQEVNDPRGDAPMRVRLATTEHIPRGTLGMWDLPEATVIGNLFAARVCDDLAGVAAALCLLDQLVTQRPDTDVLVLCSRAEEVGFAGVLAAAMARQLPPNAAVIGLETSKALHNAPQALGPIVRVGDRKCCFSPPLTYYLCECCDRVMAGAADFFWQRKLMDGGTCNSTAFLANGYDTGALCMALGNYHNMTSENDIGWNIGSRAGPSIGSETIALNDFHGMVRILYQAAVSLHDYRASLAPLRERLRAMHKKQAPLLYAKRNNIQRPGRPTPKNRR